MSVAGDCDIMFCTVARVNASLKMATSVHRKLSDKSTATLKTIIFDLTFGAYPIDP